MVWFQCEDCGENLKKPKLPGHFRMCSATKLSCIDCGQVFGKQAVQGHTQCISEAEKYGPKGQASNGTPAKPSNDKKNADVDIHVGLSERPPWFCSLCNTQATSQQTLLLHADGKKHRAKARAFHAANQPKTTEESITAQPNNVPENKDAKEESQNLPKSVSNDEVPVSENGILPVKKRKISDSDDDGAKKHSAIDVQTELGNGEVVQNQKAVDEDKKKVKKAKHDEQENGENGSSLASEKIKWKKIISSILKTTDGAVKMKKLQKLVRKSLKESGISIDVTELNNTLEHKVKTNSRFTVDGKYVRLVSRE